MASFELFIDGQRVANCKPGGSLELDTAKAADGFHELRVVALGPAPIESQGRKIVPIKFDNHGRKIEASPVDQGPYRSDAPLRLTVRSPGSIGIVCHPGKPYCRTGWAANRGRSRFREKTLGTGPVQIRVAGLGDGGPHTNGPGPTDRF